MTEPRQTPRRHWTAGAVALVVIGLLVLVPSGLCTAVMGGLTLVDIFSAGGNQEDVSIVLETLLVGAPFIALGAILVYAGFRARKQN